MAVYWLVSAILLASHVIVFASDVGKANQNFAAKLYQELSKNGETVLVSPASLEAALGLLQLGADGPTADELSQVLSLPLNKQHLLTYLASIPSALHSSPSVEVALANSIYVRTDVKLAEAFQKCATEIGASVQQLLENPDAAVVEVNNWLSSATRGLLTNVLRPGDINIDTALLLVNALYFKGRWRDASFTEKDTQTVKFHRKEGSVPVDMMRCTTYFNISRDNVLNATFLELAYVGDEFVLTVVLPDDVDGLPRLADNIDHILKSPPQMHEEQVDLQLPRFKATGAARLKTTLQKLGIKHAFNNANLSGLTVDGKPLAVSDVVHNTLLEVSEKGTEAAAASAVGIVDRIFSQPIPFYADHSFLYTLQHKPTGIILFIGHFTGA